MKILNTDNLDTEIRTRYIKAISLKEPRSFEQIEIDEPERPGPDEVLVRTARMGICGMDISGYLGEMPFFNCLLIPDHELGVEVFELGAGVSNVNPGDRCSVEPYINCGDCYACRKGNTNCCASLNVIDVMVDDGLCERFLIRADKLHPSDKLTFKQLALVETLGIGCQATGRGDAQKGDHVLIIGAGPIGLATIEFTRLTGATITVMDMNEVRLQFCRDRYGIEHTVVFRRDGSELDQMNSITSRDMYRVVTDATGSKRSMGNAVNYVAHTETLMYLGFTTEEVVFPHLALYLRIFARPASRLHAMPCRRILYVLIRFIEDGTTDTNPWNTHRTSFDGVINDLESYTKSETGVIKVIVEVDT